MIGAINRQTQFAELPEYLSVEEFRCFVGLGKSTIYDLIQRNEIPFIRIGRRILIPKKFLQEKIDC
jgi:excisionase family DNA binding protein